MAARRLDACKQCGARGRRLSRNNLCEDCAIVNMYEAARQQQTRNGPIYNTWCESMRELAERL